jgi:hypothetical protein
MEYVVLWITFHCSVIETLQAWGDIVNISTKHGLLSQWSVWLSVNMHIKIYLNVYIDTYVIIYLYLYPYIYIHIYSERDNKIVLVSLSEGSTEDSKWKENVREWEILKQLIYVWV